MFPPTLVSDPKLHVIEATMVSGMMPEFVEWLGGIGAVAGSIIAGFAWLEATASVEAKKAVANWLKRSGLRNLSWSDQFLELFDRVFGRELLSWKSFLRCSLVSFVMCMVLTVVWYSLRPREFSNFWYGVTHSLGGEFPLRWGPSVLIRPISVFALVNLPGNYLSLFIGRKVMGLMLRIRTRLKWVLALMVGTIGCVFAYSVLFLTFLRIMGITEYLITGENMIGWPYIYYYFLRGFEFNPRMWVLYNHEVSAGIFIYTSLFAVSWMWFFLASGWTVRLLSWLDPGWQKVKWFLDVENQPLRSLGIVAGVIGALMFSIAKLGVS